ncbi:MAG: hypothetical protein WDN72_06230 [Alphaproteobacteria bacterium]
MGPITRSAPPPPRASTTGCSPSSPSSRPISPRKACRPTSSATRSPGGGKKRGDGAAFRARHGIATDAPILAVFPGSRHGELNRMLPIIAGTVERLAAQLPDLQVVVQVPEPLKIRLDVESSSWKTKTLVLDNGEEKRDLFAAATARARQVRHRRARMRARGAAAGRHLQGECAQRVDDSARDPDRLRPHRQFDGEARDHPRADPGKMQPAGARRRAAAPAHRQAGPAPSRSPPSPISPASSAPKRPNPPSDKAAKIILGSV